MMSGYLNDGMVGLKAGVDADCRFFTGEEFLKNQVKSLFGRTGKMPTLLDYADWAELYADYVVEYEKRMDRIDPDGRMQADARMSLHEFVVKAAALYPAGEKYYLAAQQGRDDLEAILGPVNPPYQP